jgi:alkylation response protein AidB-like acyl-CoA dehydrogenase
MQLDLTDDQALFHETTVRFIEAELPLSRTRELHDDPLGFDRGWLRKSAELGWYAMLVPEALGGGSVSGAGLLDAAIVAEELGRHAQPGPFLPMNVVAWALATHGSAGQRAEVVPAIAAGQAVATWACADDRGTWDRGAGVRATRSGTGLVLTGTRGFVPEAPSADWLLVTAVLDDRPTQVLVPADAGGLRLRPLTGLDLSRRLAHVDLDGVAVGLDALVGGGA